VCTWFFFILKCYALGEEDVEIASSIATGQTGIYMYRSTLFFYTIGEKLMILPNDNGTTNRVGKYTSILFFFTLLFYRRSDIAK